MLSLQSTHPERRLVGAAADADAVVDIDAVERGRFEDRCYPS
jgi:hypothetical protein